MADSLLIPLIPNMNRILVAAHHTPSPLVATRAVPSPVLRGATRSVVLELHTGDGESIECEVTLPYVLDPAVEHLRVLSMHTRAIIKMETLND